MARRRLRLPIRSPAGVSPSDNAAENRPPPPAPAAFAAKRCASPRAAPPLSAIQSQAQSFVRIGVVANIAICLCHQANYLLDQQLRALEREFLAEGGLRERMSRARRAAREGGG